MDRDEVLKKSKANFKGKNLYERYLDEKSFYYGYLIAIACSLLLATILMISNPDVRIVIFGIQFHMYYIVLWPVGISLIFMSFQKARISNNRMYALTGVYVLIFLVVTLTGYIGWFAL
ncbi:hypothetical protein M2475_002013 [Breznakia sp. PF5-3]|uniref:hypothetical protein n=1 Tax=unclassified Breznakia TaxID=2623764 RepID=UPI0024061B48|nr:MULTISPECIES: hypothetical protein [unclassified Breznakia]MDF9825576.1 hypothetical protein [Breznakia sp. PM6-1]MDF9836433.1 hypothetical protein [Breznakia sp. PF5-3]MDF9838559.1 hypothetical protein [Breznakia sp. PFB2-8]MDF9860594.1 hypothetical protein [Breznakia sp. PH5-24]